MVGHAPQPADGVEAHQRLLCAVDLLRCRFDGACAIYRLLPVEQCQQPFHPLLARVPVAFLPKRLNQSKQQCRQALQSSVPPQKLYTWFLPAPVRQPVEVIQRMHTGQMPLMNRHGTAEETAEAP